MKAEILFPFLFGLLGGLAYLFAESSSFKSVPAALKFLRRIETQRDKTKVRTRLARLGRAGEYENFRLKQMTHSLVNAASSFLVTSFLLKSILGSALISLGIFLISHILMDRALTTKVNRRKVQIESEFASIIEMLTLSLSAGQTPLSAMDRIAERSSGLLALEFAFVVAEVRSGKSFHSALDEMGVRIDSVPIRRFVDALITAMLRGAPLIDVLQRHALEARANQRNVLMSKAGKAEISMMIPVVFLILPISVMFALWPSLTNLNLFAA